MFFVLNIGNFKAIKNNILCLWLIILIWSPCD